MARKSISQKLRFEVFKRDSFTCQYCGRMAPDVVLQVDHINPVKEGGDNSILNLITSCFDCNNGKGARKLTDKQEIQKQQEQLRLLSQKKEQLEWVVKWREELLSLNEDEVNIAEKEIQQFNDTYSLSEHGRQIIKDLIKKYSLVNVLEAIDIAFTKYDTQKTSETWNAAFNKVGGICYNKKREKDNPVSAMQNKAFYIFKRNFNVYNEIKVRNAIRRFVNDEESLEEFIEIAESSRTYSEFFGVIMDLLDDRE